MVTSDQLLQLITQLQGSGDRLSTRNTLLKYIRKQSKAQLVVLFALDREQQALIPLAYTGKLPDRQSSKSPTPTTNPLPSIKQRMTQPIPINDLFASILPAQKLVYIAIADQDTRIVPQELNWSYPGGSVLLNTVRASDDLQGEQGVIALCFAAGDKDTQSPEDLPTTINENEVLICSYLLSAALSKEKDQGLQGASLHIPRSHRKARPEELERETVEILQKLHVEQHGTFPELMYSLSTLA